MRNDGSNSKIFQEKGNFVEGRDIGTVMFPDAKYKFCLQADYDIRAKEGWLILKKSMKLKILTTLKRIWKLEIGKSFAQTISIKKTCRCNYN